MSGAAETPAEDDSAALAALGSEAERVAAELRRFGSERPEDPAGAADSEAGAEGSKRSVFIRALRMVMKLLSIVLTSVRVLVVSGVVLALVNAGLFLLPRRDESAFLVGAVLVLGVLLVPAWALNRVGKRFAAFRDSIVTIAEQLPQAFTLPDGFVETFAGISEDTERATGQGRIRRMVTTGRLLLRARKALKAYLDANRELIDAGVTVTTYGPQDAFLALYGAVGLGVLALVVPLFAVWAVIA